MDEVIYICDIILNGDSDDVLYTIPGINDGYMAKKLMAENSNFREDGKMGNHRI